MRRRHGGFSLIEALISVLVLSVGLLGLAQLQARLSMASSRLQASAQAYVLAGSGIEQCLAQEAADADAARQASAVVTTPTTLFATTTRFTLTERLMRAEFQVRWEDPSGSHAVSLEALSDANPEIIDARLLLPSN